MTYPEINALTSPLICLPINKPIISYSTYIKNKLLDCDYLDYWKVHLFDGYIKFDPRYLYGIFNHHKSNNIPLSATLSKITDITNKYLSDKRIYISGITPQSYHYLSRGNGKSLRELCYFIKLTSDSERSQFTYNPYSPEYTVQNYKSDMENLYKKMICKKLIISLSTNNSIKQRSNNQEEMSCLKLIADRNNTNKKFHK